MALRSSGTDAQFLRNMQKDVGDLRQRTKKGIETARLNGKIIGRPKGQHSVSEREVRAKRQMMKSVRSVGVSI